MSISYAPKMSTSDLVLYLDSKNIYSYPGEPTTNIAYLTNNYLNSGSNWWINSGGVHLMIMIYQYQNR